MRIMCAHASPDCQSRITREVKARHVMCGGSYQCLDGQLSFGSKQRVSHDFLWPEMARPHGITQASLTTSLHFCAVWSESKPARAIDKRALLLFQCARQCCGMFLCVSRLTFGMSEQGPGMAAIPHVASSPCLPSCVRSGDAPTLASMAISRARLVLDSVSMEDQVGARSSTFVICVLQISQNL